KAVNNPFNKFQCRNYRVFNSLRKEDILRAGPKDNLSELNNSSIESSNSKELKIWAITNKPAKVYANGEKSKSIIIEENKGKSGIYLWSNNVNDKYYIGSGVELSIRFRDYYFPSALNRVNNYISRAIIHHTHSVFSLIILEYIDIANLSKEQSRKLILGREQHYIDMFNPEYNLLKTAGNSLGFKHSEDVLAKMSEAQTGDKNSFYGKKHLPETLAKITIARKGKLYSSETKALISEAMTGENNHMFGRTGENHPNFGKSLLLPLK